MPDSEITMRVEGLDNLLRKLRKLGPPTYRPAIAEGGAHLKDAIAEYPPRRYGPQPPKTFKQRIFLIAAIAEGLIDVPYRRGLSPSSEGLGRRWTVEHRDKGMTAVVGNNASYVRWVHDHEQQSAYHEATGWKTDKQVVEDEAAAIRDIFRRHIQAAIQGGSEAAR